MKNSAMKIRCLLTLIAAAFAVLPASAQLAPANDAGVTMGHIHLFVKDVEAQKKFWTVTMGGTVLQNGPLLLIQFPGVYIMLRPRGIDRGSFRLCVERYAHNAGEVESGRRRDRADRKPK